MTQTEATRPDLFALARTAQASDDRADWLRLWQALAGTALVLPLQGSAGETISPRLDEETGAVLAYPSLEAMAASLTTPADYAQLDGAALADMLAPERLTLRIPGTTDILVPAEAIAWIAQTYRADVDEADLAGVRVAAVADPDPALLQALGDSVTALGTACTEAWLITLSAPDTPDGTGELTLVLALSADAAKAEAEIAHALTRAIQAVSTEPLAVACPAPNASLLAAARSYGIGIAAALAR